MTANSKRLGIVQMPFRYTILSYGAWKMINKNVEDLAVLNKSVLLKSEGNLAIQPPAQ